MDWPDERYVRLYTRDTADWLSMRWEAKALFGLLLRKADRAGVIQVAPGPTRARKVAGLVGMPADVVEPGLTDLLADACLVESDLGYTFRNFIEAQEAPQSDAQRQRESRSRRRDHGIHDRYGTPVTKRDQMASQNVTESHERSQAVTSGHIASPLAVPSRAVPSLPSRAGEEEAPPLRAVQKPSPSAEPLPDQLEAAVELWNALERERAQVFGGTAKPEPPEVCRQDLLKFSAAHQGNVRWALDTQAVWFERASKYVRSLERQGKTEVLLRESQWRDFQRPEPDRPEPGLLGALQAQELWQQTRTPTALWALVLALMRQDGQGFLSERCAKLRPGLPANGTVQLFAADPYTRVWALDFGQLVEQYLGQALGEAVVVEFPEPEAAMAAGGAM